MALEETIQKEIEGMNGLQGIREALQSSELSMPNRGNYYNAYLQTLSPADQATTLATWRTLPAAMIEHDINKGITARVKSFGDGTYKAHKDDILKYVVDQLTHLVKGAQEKGEAAEALSQALRPVLKIKDPDLTSEIKAYEKRTGHSGYLVPQEGQRILMNYAAGMAYREAAAGYVEEKDGKYSINSKALGFLLNNPEHGLVLYEIAKQIEEQVKKAEAASKQNKKSA